MPPRGVQKGTKRARQYEHIKQSQRERLGIEGRSSMNKGKLQRAVDGTKS